MKKFLLFLSIFVGLILVSIGAFAQVPTISYPQPSYSFSVGATITPIVPTSTGVTGAFGAVTTFSTTLKNASVVTYDPVSGDFYAVDYVNGYLDKITPAGVLTRLAQNPINNNAGTGIVVDGAGNIYVSDQVADDVYEFNPANGNVIRTITGLNNPAGLAVDASNNLYIASTGSGNIYRVAAGATTTKTTFLNGFTSPYGLAINSVTGDMYVAESGNAANRSLIKVIGAIGGGTAKTIYVNGTNFTTPRNLTFDSFGNLFLADATTIKMITTTGATGTVTTALSAGLTTPGQVDFDPSGNMYIADMTTTIKKSAVTYYTISPGLPTGLSFNTSTGTITGSSATAFSTAFTVTAFNTSGSKTTTITLICATTPPALAYASPQTYSFGGAVSLTPINSGGVPVTCSISPTIPGLTISNTTGAITGNPTAINAGSVTYTITATNAAGTTTSTVVITINPVPLTITPSNASMTYGAAIPALAVSYSGFVNGNTAASLTTQPSLSTTAVSGSAVGTYPITATGAVDANYTIGYVSGTLTVNQKTLTVNGLLAANKVYDQTTAETFTGGTLVGVIPADAGLVTLVAGGSFTTNTAGTAKPITAACSLSGTQMGNYILTQPTITANISQAPLTISSLSANDKVYDGTNTATYSGGSLGGVFSGDAVTFTTSGTFSSSTVGTAIPVSSTVTLGGAQAADYSITSPTNLTANITPYTLTVTAQAQTRTFGIATNYTFAYSTFAGSETAANLTTPPTVTGPPINSAAGTYTNQLIPSGAVDPNYTFNYVPATLIITAAGTSTYDWTGIANTLWENPLNWSVNGVQQTFAYPGSTDNADIVNVGVNTTIPVITNFPVMSAANITIKTLTFGYNNAPVNNTGGTLGLTVNGFTLAVTGAILQQHSSTGPNNGTANGIVTTLQGSGFIVCGSFTVGDNTLPANFVSSITRVNIGSTTASTLSVTVNGNLVINSSNFGIFFSFNASDAYLSLGAGTLTVKGTMQLTNVINGFPLISFVNPYAKFSIDLNSTNSPVLNLFGATPVTIANTGNGNISNVVDFNNPGAGAKTGIVNYQATAGTQKVFTSGDADFDSTPTVYSALTLSNASAKTVDGGSLTTSSDVNTSGGAVNLNSNNPAVTIGGNWTNSTTINEGTGFVSVTGSLANNAGGTITGNITTASTTISGSVTNNGTIACNGENMTFNSNYINNATFTAGAGLVSFNGASSGQSLQDNSATGTTFNTVSFGGSTTKTMSATGSGFFAVSSTGILTMAGTAKLAAGGVLTLRSSASGSASVAQITTTNPISGNVNVERYLTGGAGYRGYRLLSSPVNNGSGLINLQYLINSCYITGTTGTAGGFDLSQINNPSLYLFRENLLGTNTSFTSSNFRGVNDLTNAASGTYGIDVDGGPFNLYTGNGYDFFYRGDKSKASLATEGSSYTPTSTTLTATGVLNQGQVAVKHWYGGSTTLWETTLSGSTNTNGFNLVGNPYASSINWDTYSSGTPTTTGIYAPGVASFIYILMPNGSYNVYAAGAGGVSTGNIANSNIIPSGQGFFVIATGANPSITFNESAKTTVQAIGPNLFLGTPVVTALPQYMHILLAKDSVTEDGILLNFNSTANAQYVPNEDAPYKTGTGPASLSSISADNISLSINGLPLPKTGRTVIPLNVNANADGTYQLNMSALERIPAIYEVWLMDAYNKDSLDFRANRTYSFDIMHSNAATYGANRFTIVIGQNPGLAEKLLTFTATKTSGGAQVAWQTQNEQNYTDFTVERSNDGGKTFVVLGGFPSDGDGLYSLLDKTPLVGSDEYRLKTEDMNGVISYSNIVTLVYTNPNSNTRDIGSGSIAAYPNPTSGKLSLSITETAATSGYTIQVLNNIGAMVRSGTSLVPSWETDMSALMPGTYFIQVLNKKDNTLVGRSTVVKL